VAKYSFAQKSGGAGVPMMKSTDPRKGDDLAVGRGLDGTR